MITQSPAHMQVFAGSRHRNVVAAVLLGLIASIAVSRDPIDAFSVRLTLAASAFFACASLFCIYAAVRRLPRLTLSKDGFELSTGLVRRHFRWTDWHGFEVGEFVGPNVIKLYRTDTGGDGAILNLFEAPTVEICDALLKWRERSQHGT